MWKPPPRASWVDKLTAYGRALGDDGRSVVSLEPDELVESARQATGLTDVGDRWFERPLRRLCQALDTEAALHLAGRLRTRLELQVILENRLRLVDRWRREPGIQKERIEAPLIVTGLGRSGTTLLHELLACDPANRAPRLWEFLHTTDLPGATSPTQRTQLADAEITVMDDMVPAFTAMHENRGHLPTECIFAFAHQFSSDQFTGLYNVPSYTIWRSTLDQTPIYQWHKKMLQTLQQGQGQTRWVLKAPSHLSSLSLVFATYPDARVVIVHRDPLRVVGSLADMMATLHWMHSDEVDYQALVEFLCMGLELQMNAVTEERSGDSLPNDQILDVSYRSLVTDPLAAVNALYDRFDLSMSKRARSRLTDYIESRHTERGASHEYDFADTGLTLDFHRALLRDYQERFGVESEV